MSVTSLATTQQLWARGYVRVQEVRFVRNYDRSESGDHTQGGIQNAVMRRWPVCFGTSTCSSSWRPRQPVVLSLRVGAASKNASSGSPGEQIGQRKQRGCVKAVSKGQGVGADEGLQNEGVLCDVAREDLTVQ